MNEENTNALRKYIRESAISLCSLLFTIADILENNGKKPLPKDESHEYYGCPSCRHIVSSVQNYCENCGQKLDWRDIGETE